MFGTRFMLLMAVLLSGCGVGVQLDRPANTAEPADRLKEISAFLEDGTYFEKDGDYVRYLKLEVSASGANHEAALQGREFPIELAIRLVDPE